MKLSVLSIAAVLLAENALAFTPYFTSTTSSRSTRGFILSAVELKPEPEGGEELIAVKTMPGSRMKNMGEAKGNKKSDAEGTVYSFWMQATANGALIKELSTQVLKDAKKKANFPGFRKGQVPPFAMPQIRGFAVQEAIVQTAQSAVGSYGLKTIKGEFGNLEVLEEVSEIAKSYKDGDIVFTATINAIFDPDLIPEPKEQSSEEDVIVDVDAEVVVASMDVEAEVA